MLFTWNNAGLPYGCDKAPQCRGFFNTYREAGRYTVTSIY